MLKPEISLQEAINRVNGNLLEAALVYRERGIPVFPLQPGKKIPLAGSHGFKDATLDCGTIREWWVAEPQANIGIPTGPASGWLIFDIDGSKGQESLKRLLAKYGELPATLGQQTGGGTQDVFHYPAAGRVGNSADGRFGGGIDIRGEGGYIVAPPSIHPSGRTYQWLNHLEPVDAPSWLLELARGPANGITKDSKGAKPHDLALVFDGVPDGQRDDLVFRFACSRRRRGVPQAEVEHLVRIAAQNCRPPFPEKRAMEKVRSAFRSEYSTNDGPSLDDVEAARRTVQELLPRLKNEPQLAVSPESLNALALVKAHDPEQWIAAQDALRRKKILKDVTKEIRRTKLHVITSPASEDRDSEATLKAAIDKAISVYTQAEAPLDYAEISRSAFDWFIRHGGKFYRTPQDEPFLVFENTTYFLNAADKLKKGAFEALLFQHADILQTSTLGKNLSEGLRHLALNEGKLLPQLSWLHTDMTRPAVYVNLNNRENEIVRISPAGVDVLQNGDNGDGVFLAQSDKVQPMKYAPLGREEGEALIRRLFIESLACDPIDALATFLWFASGFLMDFSSTVPICRMEGVTDSGKTTGFKVLSALRFGAPFYGKSTVAALYADSQHNPLQLLDNIELASASDDLKEYLLISATRGIKEKRAKGSDSETVVESPRSLIATNGIEPVGTDLSEIPNRTFTIQFDTRFMTPGFVETEAVNRLKEHRDALLSAAFDMVALVLGMIQHGALRTAKGLIERELPTHSKRRCNDYLALMYLFSISGGNESEISEKLSNLDPNFCRWIEGQNRLALHAGAGSNSTATLLSILITKWQYARLTDHEREDFRRKYLVNMTDEGIFEETAQTVFAALKTVAKEHNIAFGIRNPQQLASRLSSDKKAIEEAGFNVSTKSGRSNKLLYSITKETVRSERGSNQN